MDNNNILDVFDQHFDGCEKANEKKAKNEFQAVMSRSQTRAMNECDWVLVHLEDGDSSIRATVRLTTKFQPSE